MNLLASLITKAYAQSISGSTGGGGGGSGISFLNPLSAYPDFCSLLNAIINNFLIVVAPSIATLFILYGAFRMLTASGDPERFEGGRKTILYAIIGLIVVLIAAALVDLIAGFFGGNGAACS